MAGSEARGFGTCGWLGESFVDCEVTLLDDDCAVDVHREWVEERDVLLHELLTRTEWEQETITLFGRPVVQPRLTAWFGVAMDAATRYRTTRPPVPWPPLLAAVGDRVAAHAGVEFNSALANLYRDGRDSVAWHADDEPALGAEPVIASVSLGATRRFALRRRDKTKTFSVDLGHGDLLVMSGRIQQQWLHSIPKTRRPVGPRINLTFRSYLH